MDRLPSILAIETATSNCSVALQHEGVVTELSEQGDNIHSQVLLTMVQELLKKADLKVNELNAVAVGQGPGSFTGLRIGIGVAQGIAYGAGCSMLGVSSLAALAAQAKVEGAVIAALDARMGEVYWAVYKSNAELIGQLQVSAPSLLNVNKLGELGVNLENQDTYLVGNAWSVYQDQFDQVVIGDAKMLEEQILPNAKGLLKSANRDYDRGAFISPKDFAPEYVRNNVAVKKTSN